MPPSNSQRPTVASLNARVDDHDERIEEIELRLNKYDMIITRLDTIIDIMTQRIESTANKADSAIESQELMKQRNEHTNRWADLSAMFVVEVIVAIIAFVLGCVIH